MSDIDPELSRAYREASSAEPPAALDAAILAAARAQAAQPRSRDRRQARSFWRNWMAPASAVATLVLGLSIALMIEDEQPGTVDESAVRALPPQPAGPLPGRAEEAAKARAADSAAGGSAANKEAPAPKRAPAYAAPQAEIESKAAGDAAAGGPGAAAPAAPAVAGRSAPLREQSLQRSPEAWLAEIERLKRDGRGEEAAQQLAQFRKAYPGYAVPEALLK